MKASPASAAWERKIVIALRRLAEPGAVLGVAPRKLVRHPAVVRQAGERFRGVCVVERPVLVLLVNRGLVHLCHESQRVMAFRIAPAGEAHLKAALERRARDRRALRRAA